LQLAAERVEQRLGQPSDRLDNHCRLATGEVCDEPDSERPGGDTSVRTSGRDEATFLGLEDGPRGEEVETECGSEDIQLVRDVSVHADAVEQGDGSERLPGRLVVGEHPGEQPANAVAVQKSWYRACRRGGDCFGQGDREPGITLGELSDLRGPRGIE